MQQSSLGIRLGFARYTAKGSLSAQGNERQQHPRAIARASAAKQREIDLGRSEKRKLSIPRLAGISPQAGARGGRRLPSQSTRPGLPQGSEVPSSHARLGLLSAILRMNSIASVVRRKTIGGLARIRSSGSIGKSGMTH